MHPHSHTSSAHAHPYIQGVHTALFLALHSAHNGAHGTLIQAGDIILHG